MAAARKRDRPTSLIAPSGAPLIALFAKGDEKDEVRYFASEEEVDAAISDQDVHNALALFGAWSDLDWDDLVTELDRLRHASPPTPPIDLDEFE